MKVCRLYGDGFSLWFPWWRIRARAGLQDLRLHDLRHSFASFLVNEDVSLYVVQALLGHANARTTQRYAHLASDTLTEATEIVDGIVAAQPRMVSRSPPRKGFMCRVGKGRRRCCSGRTFVIASEAKQSRLKLQSGLLRRYRSSQ